MQKSKKTLLILIITVVTIVAMAVLFISPLTKYLVEKYDEKYTGRQITMHWAYVNPFTGYVYFNDLKIYELKSDSLFFSTGGISINISLLKLFSKTYEISELTLDHPYGIVIQNKKDLNFNDLIEKFSSKENSNTTKPPIHFNILNIKIKEGEFHYREQVTPINYFIKNVNIESGGKCWDIDTIGATFSFLSGIGSGDMKGDFTVNSKNNDYHLSLLIRQFDLNIIGQYLKDLTNYGSFSATLDADMKSKGNFDDKENNTTSGLLTISDFHFGKNPKEDYASFDKLVVDIIELSPKKHIYSYDSISLNQPYFKYERYDRLDNLQTMFGKNGSNLTTANADTAKFNLVIEIANHIKVLSKNFLKSNYKIGRLAIYNGDIRFNDYSIHEQFALELNPLSIIADSIYKNHDRVNLVLRSDIKPYGNALINLSVNPKDSSDFDLQYRFQKLPMAMFNPYLISYTTFPLDRGTIELNGKWKVRNGNIQSSNHLVIIDPRVGKRIKIKDIKRVPVRLIMSFIRERGNVIDYEIPITGNLNDPKFHFRDVILDVLENIIVKPLTTPYRMEVKSVETEIEKAHSLKWQTRHSSLSRSQENFIKKMADFLTKNPDASLDIYPQHYEIKEKEYILFFEAKKHYFLASNNKNKKSFTYEDSILIDRMSVKDSMFIDYLNGQVKDSIMFTVQDKCNKLIGQTSVNVKFKELNVRREGAFMIYFKKSGVEKQIKIYDDENVIPYNGFSFYKIEYNFEFPPALLRAYQEMDQLNHEEPRKEFFKRRKKIKS